MIFRPRQKTLPITRQVLIIIEIMYLNKYIILISSEFILISTLRGKLMLILLRLRFLNLPGYFIKLNTICTQNLFFTLYYALIYPYLTYCNLIWASTYVTNLQRIYLLQRRAVRAISKADYKASSKPRFANLKILDVFSIYSLQVSSFMYLYHHDALAITFTQIFQTGNQIHQYSTRYSDFYRDREDNGYS